MRRAKLVRLITLAGALVWAGGAAATTLCTFGLPDPSGPVTVDPSGLTGACALSYTETGAGGSATNVSESATNALSETPLPPADASASTVAKGRASFPAGDGTGGTVGALATATASASDPLGAGAIGSGLFIGEFTAFAPSGSTVTVDVGLGFDGMLALEGDGIAFVILSAVAVDADQNPLGTFGDLAVLSSLGFLPFSAGGPDPCAEGSTDCATNATTKEFKSDGTTLLSFEVDDGETFGLSFFIGAGALSGELDKTATADFFNTANLSLSGQEAGVTFAAAPANVNLSEPGSLALYALGIVGICASMRGRAARRRRAGRSSRACARDSSSRVPVA